MGLLLVLFIILHALTGAAWFGLGLRLPATARAILHRDRAAAQALAAEGRRTAVWMNLFLVLTFVFSLVAFFAGGGFVRYGAPYHTSLMLIVFLLVAQFAAIHPAWRRIAAAVAQDPMPTDSLQAARKQLVIGAGVGHLLWLIIFVLMFWNRLLAVI
jgi:hypothetical protein